MKILSLRNLFLVALALPLVMLFGCSSSEEAPPPDTGGDTYNQDCKDACMAAPSHQQDECLYTCEL
jgi:hypothetical protein